MAAQNQALADELEAVTSIYDKTTCTITQVNSITSATSAVLKLPDVPFSFLIDFPPDYPDVPPEVITTQSTGASTKIGQGEAATTVLRDVLGSVFVPGQVCLFDLIEETTPLLRQEFSTVGPSYDGAADTQYHDGTSNNPPQPNSSQIRPLHDQDLTSSTPTTSAPKQITSTTPAPGWIISEPLVVNKSTFVARALVVRNLNEAMDSIDHLLATNKRVASATHNITAWRIKQKQHEAGTITQPPTHTVASPDIVIQDCDDDGETAAGGRLLHLMQSMDVWNVVVVVTRWYGGVKLGPDRFRCINNVAREALVNAGFGKTNHEPPSGSGKGKGKKK